MSGLKNQYLMIRLTDDQRARLKSEAERRGMAGASSLARWIILREIGKIRGERT